MARDFALIVLGIYMVALLSRRGSISISPQDCGSPASPLLCSTRIFLHRWNVSCTASAVISKGELFDVLKGMALAALFVFSCCYIDGFSLMDPASGCGEHVVDDRDAALQQVAECWAWPDLSPTAPAQACRMDFCQARRWLESMPHDSAESTYSHLVRFPGTGG